MSTHTHSWNDISGRPSVYPPESHNHNDIYYTESEINNLLTKKMDNTKIQYTIVDPGDNISTSLPDGTLICVYEEV